MPQSGCSQHPKDLDDTNQISLRRLFDTVKTQPCHSFSVRRFHSRHLRRVRPARREPRARLIFRSHEIHTQQRTSEDAGLTWGRICGCTAGDCDRRWDGVHGIRRFPASLGARATRCATKKGEREISWKTPACCLSRASTSGFRFVSRDESWICLPREVDAVS